MPLLYVVCNMGSSSFNLTQHVFSSHKVRYFHPSLKPLCQTSMGDVHPGGGVHQVLTLFIILFNAILSSESLQIQPKYIFYFCKDMTKYMALKGISNSIR